MYIILYFGHGLGVGMPARLVIQVGMEPTASLEASRNT